MKMNITMPLFVFHIFTNNTLLFVLLHVGNVDENWRAYGWTTDVRKKCLFIIFSSFSSSIIIIVAKQHPSRDEETTFSTHLFHNFIL